VTVREHDQLADRFENHRAHLQAVAYRMLGSPAEADDAVKEAWLRLSRADTSDVANLGGWLTTVVANMPGHAALTHRAARAAARGVRVHDHPREDHQNRPAGRAGAAAPA
jgi:DNA-directed RNA polymerase specialized sigma24 family protein